MSPEKLISTAGAPSELFSFRGQTAKEDDVVFYYDNHSYFFFFNNRIWQVRFDRNYQEEVYRIKNGMTEDEVTTILGEPIKKIGDSWYFFRPDQGYPVRLRVVFSEEKVSDLYLYRGDY